MDKINLNGVEYISANKSEDIRIVILQRGWVFIGRYSQSGNECMLTDAKNYRYQGGKQGFGFVANNGPSSDCKLDPCELPIKFHPLTVIATLDCNGDKWTKLLT